MDQIMRKFSMYDETVLLLYLSLHSSIDLLRPKLARFWSESFSGRNFTIFESKSQSDHGRTKGHSVTFVSVGWFFKLPKYQISLYFKSNNFQYTELKIRMPQKIFNVLYLIPPRGSVSEVALELYFLGCHIPFPKSGDISNNPKSQKKIGKRVFP